MVGTRDDEIATIAGRPADNLWNGDRRMLKKLKKLDHPVLGGVIFGGFATAFCYAVWISSKEPSRYKTGRREAAQVEQDQRGKSIFEWEWGHADPGVTLFTIMLVLVGSVQAGLFVWQLSLTRKTLKPAEDAAIAAREAANATKQAADIAREEFIAEHRPKIKIHVAEFKHIPDNYPDESKNNAAASLLCFNVGESAAKNVEITGEIFRGSGFSVDVQRKSIKTIPAVASGEKFRVEIKSDCDCLLDATTPYI
jgi:hypothetical protein